MHCVRFSSGKLGPCFALAPSRKTWERAVEGAPCLRTFRWYKTETALDEAWYSRLASWIADKIHMLAFRRSFGSNSERDRYTFVNIWSSRS